jgi:RimJ/RimL family protein N-acetyltransferase
MVSVLADPALYIHTGGSPPSLAELQARYARQVVGTSPDGSEGWLNWLLRLRSDDRLVGFVQAALSGEEAKLAWVVAPSEQGTGLATEAASALVDWLERVGFANLRASIHPDNGASAAVAGHLGMVATDVTEGGETVWVSRRSGSGDGCRD